MNAYVCKRCGLPVRLWSSRADGPDYWKHSGGWHSKPSCGQKPQPILAAPSNNGERKVSDQKLSSAGTATKEPWWIAGDRERLEQMRNAIKKQPETAMVRYCGDMRPVSVSDVRVRMAELEARITRDIAEFNG